MDIIGFFFGMIFFSLYIYFVSFVSIITFQFTFWALYYTLLPIILLVSSYYVSRRILFPFKIRRYVLPLLIFLLLQFIPLPRSPYVSSGGISQLSARNEPFAIGIGYPFSIIKVFLGEGCLHDSSIICKDRPFGQAYIKLYSFSKNQPPVISSGDVALLPEGMTSVHNWFGITFVTWSLWVLFDFQRFKKIKATP